MDVGHELNSHYPFFVEVVCEPTCWGRCRRGELRLPSVISLSQGLLPRLRTYITAHLGDEKNKVSTKQSQRERKTKSPSLLEKF